MILSLFGGLLCNYGYVFDEGFDAGSHAVITAGLAPCKTLASRHGFLVFGVLDESGGTGIFYFGLEKDPMSPTRFALLEINPSARITSIATGGDVIAYVLATADPPTGAVDITFVDLPDPLPESDHTNDDANAADDENVTGFPPVDDLTDGARGWCAGFAAAACAVALF